MTIEKIKDRDLKMLDAFINILNGFGGQNDPNNQLTFRDGQSLDSTKLESLYRYDWLARRVVESFPKEGTRNGYKCNLPVDDELYLKNELSELCFDENLYKALVSARLYGGSALLVGALDGRSPNEPLNKNAIANIAYLHVANAYELNPYKYYSNTSEQKYGQVEIYNYQPISAAGNTQSYLIHESRLILLQGENVSKNQEIRNKSWSDSVLQSFYESLKLYGTSMQLAGHLLQDFVSKIWNLPNLADYIADEENSGETFTNRIKAMAKSLSNTGAIVLGENETYQKLATPVAGIADIIKIIQENVAAASDIPKSVLFGESLGQLSGAEQSRKNWFDKVEAYQKITIKPVIESMIDFMLYNRSFKLKYDATDYSIQFYPLWSQTPKELLEMKKIQTDIDKINIEAGILSVEEVRAAYYGEYTFDRKANEENDRLLNEEMEEEETEEKEEKEEPKGSIK